MRILDIDPEMIKVARQLGNHRKILTLETRAGELLGVELTDEEVSRLVERMTAAETVEGQ